MKFVDTLNLKGKKVFLRSDLDTPLNDAGTELEDDTRLKAAVPTIKLLLEKGAAVIIAGHLDSPKGKRVESCSLRAPAKRMGELLGQPVPLAPDCIGPEVQTLAAKLQPGQVLMLENTRFHSGEEKNDEEFAKALAALADVYVNDAFATSHRKHASTAGMAKFFTEKAAGLNLKKELEYFSKAFDNPEKPFVAVFGGAKISTKIAAIRNAAKRAQKVIVGGAMANTFFAATGINVGKSLIEPTEVENVKKYCEEIKNHGCELVLPVDAIIGKAFAAGTETKVVGLNEISPDWMILDIGPKSRELFAKELSNAKTILWNGPMGAFEIPEFSEGTFSIARTMAELTMAPLKALTVVGGGDTDLALHQSHTFDKMSYVSTAGGAFLKLLEGGEPLPAIVALG
ncbi:phosphoglycerate kinase [bacterium]|nr:phosphoglycerate kinase [bacterium]